MTEFSFWGTILLSSFLFSFLWPSSRAKKIIYISIYIPIFHFFPFYRSLIRKIKMKQSPLVVVKLRKRKRRRRWRMLDLLLRWGYYQKSFPNNWSVTSNLTQNTCIIFSRRWKLRETRALQHRHRAQRETSQLPQQGWDMFFNIHRTISNKTMS